LSNLLFFKGQKLQCRGEDWQVEEAQKHVMPDGREIWEIRAIGTSGIVRDQRFAFLSDIDEIDPVDPTQIKLKPDSSRNAQKTKAYLEANLRRLLPRNGALYLGKHGAFDPMDYQLEPTSKALHGLRHRILIGDAVGLGKTVECGILLSELARRGKARRVLCAVPKAILEQFQMEMWGRFAIPFHRLDSLGLERIRQNIPSSMNPFFHFDKVIISIDTLKMKKYQKLLEETHWDVLIVDEAHNVADRSNGLGGSMRYKTIQRLATPDRTHSVILMSATPHDGTKQGFASLIQLLDKTAIPNDGEYTKDQIDPYFIRRTRSDVSGQISNKKPRKNISIEIPLSTEETDCLQRLHAINFISKSLNGKKSKRGMKALFKTGLIKGFLSSPEALLETTTKKLNQLEKIELPDADVQQDINNLKNIISYTEPLKGKSTRLNRLKEYLNDNPTSPKNKLVIFTERRATQKAIVDYLLTNKLVDNSFDPKDSKQAKGKLVAAADGSMADFELNAIVKEFQAGTSKVEVLVATNVASEGLNLHQACHRLIHFDLPWSFITLEQRNGRIDRLGQEKQPIINYFISTVENTTRESDLKDLKDDFWIKDKLLQRMENAAEDMSEESIRNGFTTAEEEEAHNTEKYDRGETDDGVDYDKLNFLKSGAHIPKKPAYTGELPSLYDDSPGEFVVNAAQELGLDVKKDRTRVSIKLNDKMLHELKKWPDELFADRNASKEILLEESVTKMAKHYTASANKKTELNYTFMNEIHPAISLLETNALGLYGQNEVPVIHIDAAPPGSALFLLQGTLFSFENKPVIQEWNIVEVSKTNDSPQPYLNESNETKQTKDVVSFIKEAIANSSKQSDLDELSIKRIESKAKVCIEWMKEHMTRLREERGAELRESLSKELSKIKEWSKERKDYLKKISEMQETTRHAGTYASAAKAKAELARVDDQAKAFKSYCSNLRTNDDAVDIRVLAVFVNNN
jgi:ERCC4-related helicase